MKTTSLTGGGVNGIIYTNDGRGVAFFVISKKKRRDIMMQKIRSLFVAAIALAASFVSSSALAATPVVVWSGDFLKDSKTGTDNKTYTIVPNTGNSIASDGSYVQIGDSATLGALINISAGVSKPTIVVRYENMVIGESKYGLASFQYNSGTTTWPDAFSIAADGTNSKKLTEVGCNLSKVGFTHTLTPECTPSEGAGCYAVCIDSKNAIRYYANPYVNSAPSGWAYKGYWNTSSWQLSGSLYNSIAVGGFSGSIGSASYGAVQGMKITGLAVFVDTEPGNSNPSFFSDLRWPNKWIGGSTGDWSDSTKWALGHAPQSDEVAILGEDDVVNVDANASLTGVTVQGAGRVIFTDWAKIPTGSWTNPEWKGTLELKNVTKTSGCKLDWLGNAESSICFNGFTGYAFSAPNDANYPLATFKNVEIGEGGLNVTGGFSSSYFSSINGNLIGSGTITMSATCSKKESGYEFVGDPSGFSGSVNVSNGSGANMNVGFETERKTTYSLTGNRQIVVGEGVTVGIGEDKTWTASNGVHVYGTITGAGTIAGATTFGENSSVVASLDGALTISGAITGTVKIDGSAIDDAETKPDCLKVLTATAETKPTCELFGVEGYELFWKGDDLYAGDSAKRALYKQFSYAGAIYTWRGANEIANAASLYYVFDPDFGIDQGTVEGVDYFKGNGTKYANVPGGKATEHNFWTTFAYSNSTGNNGEGYEAPGCVLRFVESSTYNKTIGGGFGPLSLGGLLVEKGATGYKFEHTSGGRSNLLGDPTGTAQTYWAIYENFAYNRNGAIYLSGALVFDVADGKVFDLNSGRDANSQSPILVQKIGIGSNGNFGQSVAGGTLVMKGGGKLKVAKLTALGSTLDYSNLELGRESAFIEGGLTVDKDTTFMFPKGFEPTSEEKPSSFKLCDGTISGPEKIIGANIYVGGVKLSGKELVFDLQNGKVSYQDISAQTITVTEDISISDIEAQIESGYTGVVMLNFKADGLALVIDKAIPFSSILLECDGLVTLAAEDADDAYVPVADDFNKINWNDVSVTNKRIYRNIAPFGTAPTAGMTYRYEGTKTLAEIPFVGSAYEGVVDVACDVAGSEGSVYVTGSKSMSFSDGANYETPSFVLGNSSGVSQSFTQNGGTLEFTKTGSGTSTSSAFVLGHWPSTVAYNLVGGTITVPNDNTVFGWDGTAAMTIGGNTSTAKLTTKGIATGQGDNANTLTIGGNGTLSIGSYGANLKGSTTVTLNGGTLEAYDTGTFAAANANGIQLAADSTINVAENKVLTITSSFSGSGSITKTGAGTLKFDNSHLFYGTAVNTGTELVITGGTLDLNGAYTWSDDGSGFLTQKPITLGSATTIIGGNVTFYNNSNIDNIIYDGGNGANEPAEFAASWHSSYTDGTRTRNINVGKGAGEDYDLLISGALGIVGGQFGGTTIHKTGEGTVKMTGEFNMPTLLIDTGTWKMGAAKAVAANTTVGAGTTLDVNGQTATMMTLTLPSTGTILSDTPATINITSSATISGSISGVTLVSQGGEISVTDATGLDDDVEFVVDLDNSFIGATPFTFADPSLYASVKTKGDSSALKYDRDTHKVVYGGERLSDTMIWLPIGDSITEGEQYMGHPGQGDGNSRGGYRYQLYSQLTEDAGQNVRLVGYRTGHMGTVEADDCPWAWHAAQYGGVIAHDSNGSHGGALFDVENTLQVAGYPDVITILLGVNDLSMGNPTAANIYDSMDAMVKKIAKMRPNSKILVSTLLPAGGSRGYIDTYNTLLREKSTQSASPFNLPNVKLADVNAKFGPYNAAYFKGDNLHPNENGSIRVARSFMGFMATAIGEIVDGDTKMVHIHNGESGYVLVRFSKALDENATATLTITGTDVDGNAVEQTFENGVVDTNDKRVMRFTIPENTTLKGGVYTATLSAIDTEPLSSDFVEIQGTGAAENIDKAYREGFQRYGTVTFTNGTITDNIGSGDNWNGAGPTFTDVQEDLKGNEIKRVGYYLELKRANESSQFVWVSMDAFNTSLSNLLVPTVEAGAHKAKVTTLQVYANRANVTNTEINDGVVDTTQTGVVEFTPWDWAGTEQSGYPNDVYSGRTGWNDTLRDATAGTLKGGMQVFRYTGEETVDTYTKFAAETVFAVNNFNCDTAMDLGIGSFSTHRSNAGGNATIACTWDWSDFASLSKYTKFAVNAYEVKKMEIWVVPMTKIVWTGEGTDNSWNTPENWNTDVVPVSYSDVEIPANATIELNSDITIASLTVADASASITGTGSIKITNIAASTLKGTATIVFDGSLPDETVRTQLQATDWKGEAILKGISTSGDFHPEYYGNANSIVTFCGITPACLPESGTFNGEIKLINNGTTDAWTMGNGYSRNTTGYVIAKLSGDGNFTDTNAGVTQQITINDGSAFTGNLTIVGKRWVFGTTAVTDEDSKKRITVQDGQKIKFARQTWSATNGVLFGPTVKIVGSIGDYITMPEPSSIPGVITDAGNASDDLALKYEDGKLKIVAAGAKTADGKSYETIEEAINANDGKTIGITKDTELNIDALSATFILDQESLKNNKISWTDIAPTDAEGSGKYLACDGEGTLTVKEGEPTGEFTSFECYVLGIDASKQDGDKPVLNAPPDDGKANKLTASIDTARTIKGVNIKLIAVSNDGLVLIEAPGNSISLDLPDSGEIIYTIKVEVVEEATNP